MAASMRSSLHAVAAALRQTSQPVVRRSAPALFASTAPAGSPVPAAASFGAASNTTTAAPAPSAFLKPTYAQTPYGDVGVPTVLEPVAAKFVNCLMYDGKKSLAQGIFEKTIALIKASELAKARTAVKSGEVTTADAMTIFHQAINNAKPIVGLTPLRKGGSVHQIPTPLTPQRQLSLAIKWIIHAARERRGKNMEEKLYHELMDALRGEGSVVRKKIELHKMAEANRANISIRYA